MYCELEVTEQERPGVDKVDPVHGHQNYTVPSLKTAGQAVFDKEGVWEHKSMLLIAKKNGPLTARTHLKTKDKNRCK